MNARVRRWASRAVLAGLAGWVVLGAGGAAISAGHNPAATVAGVFGVLALLGALTLLIGWLWGLAR